MPEGKPLRGGPCRRTTIEEVDVRPPGGRDSEQDPNDPKAWENEISKADLGDAIIYSDGSLLEGGRDGGGAVVMER